MPDKKLNAKRLVEEAFARLRAPRSNEYKLGVLAALKFRIDGVRINCPFPEGTAEADAFYSGTTEGHEIWREQNEGKAVS